MRVIYENEFSEVDPEELSKKLTELIAAARSRTTTTTCTTTSKLRLLKDSEILEVKELLKPAYRPGQRQYLCLYLAGWGAHSRIHPISIARIIKLLHDETNDEDKLEERLSTIPYSYAKLGLWTDDVKREFEE